MERLAFLLAIRSGTEQAYDAAHETMSDALHEVYRAAGLRNWTMFRLATEVVGYVECDGDIRAALAAVADHPLERAFNDRLAEVFVDETDPRHGMRELKEIWHGR